MKRLPRLLSLACAAGLPWLALAADPTIGAKRADVLAELGQPTATTRSDSREVMMFSRGKVVLENGLVTQVALRTKEEYEQSEKRRLADDERRREENAQKAAEQQRLAAALAERRKIGEAELTKLVDTPEWIKLTGDERLDVLARFAKRHPDADLSHELALARAKLGREQADRDRIAELERRLAAAEQRAEAAEARAAAAGLLAQRAEQRAEAAGRANTVYLPAPIVTHVCEHPQPATGTVLRFGNATVSTTRVTTPPCAPIKQPGPVAPATNTRDTKTPAAPAAPRKAERKGEKIAP